MNDSERLRILEMLEQGKITAAEAADLLSALGERSGVSGPTPRPRPRSRWGPEEHAVGRARWFRVRVTDTKTGRTRANITVPIGMVGVGLGFAGKFKHAGSNRMDDLVEAVRSGRRGTVFDVSSDDGGQRVEIIIE